MMSMMELGMLIAEDEGGGYWISRGFLGQCSLWHGLPASNRPVELQGLILAWVGSWVQAVLPEWSSGFWNFPSLHFFQMAISSPPKMLGKLSSCSQFLYLILILHCSTCQGWGSLAAAARGDLEPRDHEFLHFAARIFSLTMGTQVAHPEQRLEAGAWKISIFQY